MPQKVAQPVEGPGVNFLPEADSFPVLLTESELIDYLRIPEVSSSRDFTKVIKYLIRYRDLPRIHLCNKILFPKRAIMDWIEKETVTK